RQRARAAERDRDLRRGNRTGGGDPAGGPASRRGGAARRRREPRVAGLYPAQRELPRRARPRDHAVRAAVPHLARQPGGRQHVQGGAYRRRGPHDAVSPDGTARAPAQPQHGLGDRARADGGRGCGADRRRGPCSSPTTAPQRRQRGLSYSAALCLCTAANDVLELARGGDRLADREPRPFSIVEVFKSVRDMVQPIAEEKGLPLHLKPARPDWRLGHARALSRVLLNLTTNALKFTEQGFVELAARPLDAARVEFSIRDTGPVAAVPQPTPGCDVAPPPHTKP